MPKPRGGGVGWDGGGGGRGRGRGGGRGGKMASTTRRVHTRSAAEAAALHVATQNCTRCGCIYTTPCTVPYTGPYTGLEASAAVVCDNCKVAEANMSFLHDPVAARWQFRPLTQDELESPAGDTLPPLFTLLQLSTAELEAQMDTVLRFDSADDDVVAGDCSFNFDALDVKQIQRDGCIIPLCHFS